MSDRSIILKDFEVRAFLEGRKSQKRMLMPHQKELAVAYSPVLIGTRLLNYACEEEISRPAFAVGDRLWVRETWQALSFGDYLPTRDIRGGCDFRHADSDCLADLSPEVRGYPWRPSTQMPRQASRLTLIVEDVKVERLQDISEEDARAEGVFVPEAQYARQGSRAPVFAFAAKWEETNGSGSWERNPWVCTYTLRPILKNIDAISMYEAT